MKTTQQLLLLLIVVIGGSQAGFAQSLDAIKIGHCTSERDFNQDTVIRDINARIAHERNVGLVMDARPFAINQSTGKLLFTRGDGRVSVVHMNPFLYDYQISVAQQELVSTAVSDFLKLLLPPKLAAGLGTIQSGDVKAVVGDSSTTLRQIEMRIPNFPNNCAANDFSCQAKVEIYRVYSVLKASINTDKETGDKTKISPLFAILDSSVIHRRSGGGEIGGTNALFVSFKTDITNLRNQQFEAYDTCSRGQQLNETLFGYDFNRLFGELNTAQEEISRIAALATELENLVKEYNADSALNNNSTFRCNGFSCAAQFTAYATQVKAVVGGSNYQSKLQDLRQKGQEMQNMFTFTERLKDKEGMFARSFSIAKKFELSQATISIKRVDPTASANTNEGTTQSGTVPAGSATSGGGSIGSGGSEGSMGNNKTGGQAVPGATPTKPAPGDDATDKPAGATPLVADQNETVQLGRPRFMLSGGMVYSPLPRRTFKPVKGFVLNAQGNPTGKGDANVLGFDQNSSRRLLPMLFLNSRLLDYEKGSLFFSLGISAKHDDNVDIEYLLGPSVSFLNDRALFTFGAYGGLTQNLVDDVKIGDALPDSLGSDIKFFRKSLTWKPGFSFSYSLSRTKKGEGRATSGETATAAAEDLRNEIRIGSVPFSFALGLVATSLEQRTYDQIAGFARDRQGNLTNGKTLTRIVGLTSSSDYRLTPMAMLHTRLTNFGRHDFYFTTGLTGKKTDNDFDLEYLLGGSVNVYRRKIFMTFGTFIGKQEILGGNFFEGAAIDRSQPVTTTKRYVWKPAVSFSYDISRIIPRSN